MATKAKESRFFDTKENMALTKRQNYYNQSLTKMIRLGYKKSFRVKKMFDERESNSLNSKRKSLPLEVSITRILRSIAFLLPLARSMNLIFLKKIRYGPEAIMQQGIEKGMWC